MTISFYPCIEDKFILLEYQRFFINNHIGLSGGAGYIDFTQKSAVFPVNITYMPFTSFLKPYIFCGGVFSYNWRDDVDRSDDREPVFDKGTDVCFDWGLGLSVSPVFSSLYLGVSLHAYTDFARDGTTDYNMSINVGYLF
jgi:hypothetical protein